MPYTSPSDVVAPQKRFHLVDVLLDKGENQPSYAIGVWDKRKVIVFRWNGSTDSPGGNPQSRGHATWIVLDDALYAAVVAMLPQPKQIVANAFFSR
jgi:hypothetical protein